MIYKRVLSAVMCLCTALYLCSCIQRVRYMEESFFSMDTFMYMKAEDANSAVMRDVKARIYEIEREFSRTFSESTVSKINALAEGGTVTLGEDALALLEKSLEVSESTDFAFNPCLGRVKDIWEECKLSQKVPSRDEIESALKHSSPLGLSFDAPYLTKLDGEVSLDLGAVAKGYAAEEAVKIFKDGGVKNAMLNLGGNIAVIGESAQNTGKGYWTVGIKNPFDTGDIIGSLDVTDCYISVSGGYERYFEVDGEIFHHIINPNTGFPADNGVASVAVISNDGALADALSTALFVMGKEKALEFYECGTYRFEAIIVTQDGEVTATRGLTQSFLPNQNAKCGDGTPLRFAEE